MSKRCGIYIIYVLRDNVKKSPLVYVGQSRNIQQRWSTHKRAFKTYNLEKYHSNLHLVDAVRKYDNVTFEILEECLVEDLTEQEAHWIDYYKNHIDCEVCNIADPYGTVSEYEGHLIAEGHRKRRGYDYAFYDKNGSLHIAKDGLVAFCKSLGLNPNRQTSFRRLWLGEIYSYKGFTTANPELTDRVKLEGGRPKSVVTFISPGGKLYTTPRGVSPFAREMGLKEKSMQALAAGKAEHYLGWRLYHEGDPVVPWQEPKPYTFKSPIGDYITVERGNVSEFCRQNNLGISCISQLVNGKAKQHKGWTLA